jgi:urease accessory protein
MNPMCAAVFPYEPLPERRAAAARALQSLRQVGGTELVFRRRGAVTAAADVGECGGYRVRLPRGGHGAEAVLLNTGGGMAGGDRAEHTVAVARSAAAVVTTNAAERIYRSLGPRSEIHVRLEVGPDAALAWMPQETILYDGGILARRLEADMHESARLLVLELTVFGRRADGVRPRAASLRDTWRVRRGGRLVFAENLALEGDLDLLLGRPAVAGDGSTRVTALLLYAASDAADKLASIRQALAHSGEEAGASTWHDLLVVRVLGSRVATVRDRLAAFMPTLIGRDMPRTWWT